MLAETCIQCARHSYRLLSEAWIHGSFAIFDYLKAQYLFSSSTILAISSLLGSARSQNDEEDFYNAAEILKQLDQNGNFGAEEFCQHLDEMKKLMGEANAERNHEQTGTVGTASGSVAQGVILPNYDGITGGMALAEPSLQEFLAEPDLNLQLSDTPTFEGMQTPYWPELWGDGWATG